MISKKTKYALKALRILAKHFGENSPMTVPDIIAEESLPRLIRLIDGPIAPTLCVSLHFYGKCDDCVSEEACKIRPLMMKVRDANLNVYENVTLADML